MAQPSWSVVRRAVASLASLAIAPLFLRAVHPRDLPASEWITLGPVLAVPITGAAAIWIQRLAAQLLARGLWWSVLLIDTLVVFSAPTHVARDAAGFAALAAVALLSAGREGLDAGPGQFQPVAFRGTLMLALVLAMADVAVFLAGGLSMAFDSGRVTMLLLVAPMVAAVVGLLRLRTWALLLGLMTNVVVATLVLTRILDVPTELFALFVGSAGLQLVIPIPMLVTILRRRVPPPDRWQCAKRVATTTVILAMAAISVSAAFIREPTFRSCW